ncbi:hypothetical protein WIW50_03595 [Flavobacteriaceae bacterium 3-367]|uniref:hypothetical protein n=1 Tax=Eudoraea algarum TaxID=3417568 RepID=UPI003292A7A4
MKKAFLFLLMIGLLGFAGCNTDDDATGVQIVILQVTDADFPVTFTVGEVYTIEVTFLIPDACTLFEGFDFTSTGLTERQIVAIGTRFPEEACLPDMEERTATFDFEVFHDQTYIFRIWTGTDENGENEFLTFEVPVN